MVQVKSQAKIAIVDDHNLFRKGLITLINLGDMENKYTILFEAENGNDLVNKLSKKQLPDIILMDIVMPDKDGFETVDWIKKHYPNINILVISMFESEEDTLRMIKLGVKGYLSKDMEVEDMHSALESIAQGKFYYSNNAQRAMAESIQGNNVNVSIRISNGINLNENERRFIKFACSDLTYQQIAEKMHLSPKTIEGYRDILFRRFNVKSRVGLTIFAIKNKLVTLP